ncbi:MAG: tetratricopeptide repeat protein, partial [Vulcanimicrobiaceae bacterium]
AREILGIAPTLSDAHFLLGKALAAQRRFRDARDAFAAAIENGQYAARHPLVDNEVSLWKAHSEIGATLMEEGGYALALAWFDLALKARPAVQPVRLNRAKALERLGRFDDARDALAAVWQDDRDHLSANEYVNFLLRRGDEPGALRFIEEAAPALDGEARLIFYGSAAAIASRNGLSGTEGYLSLAEAVEGVDHPRERLAGLLRNLEAPGALALLAANNLA